jgi:hypothetical protein
MFSIAAAAGPPSRVSNLLESTSSFFETGDDGVVRLRDLDANQLEQLEQAQQTLSESANFRPGAKGTHAQLDLHLREYRRSMILWFTMQKRADELQSQNDLEDANDQLFFPQNAAQMFANIEWYLTFICPALRPRSRADDRISIRTLTTRRWSMIHWMNIHLDHPPSYSKLQAMTNRALYYVAEKHGVRPGSKQKPYFGRPELQYLIDMDIASTPVEVAESHHLLWTLAFICGIRPGAAGMSSHRPDNYLRWKNVIITRDLEDNHRFVSTWNFPNQKGYQDLSSKARETENNPSLELIVNPPNNSDNIPICPTYRLLIIALRRGLLASYTTVQELLSDDKAFIHIKPECLEQPIFYAVKHGGSALDKTRAASAKSFSTYMKLRTEHRGLETATIYAFRREFGTRIDRQVGRSAARRAMHHGPGSSTYEQYYERGNFDLDVGYLAYGALSEGPNTRDMASAQHPVLYRVELHMSEAAKREQINEYVSRWTSADASHLEVIRARRYARKALRDLAKDVFNQTVTLDQIQSRRDELNDKSKLMQAVYDRARASAESANPSEEDDENENYMYDSQSDDEASQPDVDEEVDINTAVEVEDDDDDDDQSTGEQSTYLQYAFLKAQRESY